MWKGRDLFQKESLHHGVAKEEAREKNACVTVDETTPAAFQRCRKPREFLYSIRFSKVELILLLFCPDSLHELTHSYFARHGQKNRRGTGRSRWRTKVTPQSPHTHCRPGQPGPFQTFSTRRTHTHTHTRSSDEKKKNKTLWECSRSFVLRATDEFEGSVLNLFSFPPQSYGQTPNF